MSLNAFLQKIGEHIKKIENAVQNAKELKSKIAQKENKLIELKNKIQNLLQLYQADLENLADELKNHHTHCPRVNDITSKQNKVCRNITKLQNLRNDINGLINPVGTLYRAVAIFIDNYLKLLHDAYILKRAGSDKYYHAKANCEVVQELGILGKQTAKALSDFKEYYDQFTYIHTHHVTIEEAIKDSEKDQAANEIGRTRGRNYPNCKCSELVKDQLHKH